MYCTAVLDAHSRRIVGWSIDSKQDSTLVVNALDMVIWNRQPEPDGIVHADHATQFTSWNSDRVDPLGRAAALVRDRRRRARHAMVESFRSSMQIELLNRRRSTTRVELANAIFEYIEIFYNRQRRHLALATAPQSSSK